MSALLTGLREVLAHTLGAGVETVVAVTAGLPPLLADRGQLETVLVNLATNARDAMPGGGRLTFSASERRIPDGPAERLPPGAYLRLLVEDTGTGMDAATLARAMEPFFTTKGVGKGTGLGLAMARGFAEQSGGALTVSSEPGRGTEVALWLPVTDPTADGSARVTAASVRDPVAGRILLVDDEDLVREVLAEELADDGYGVVQAEGGATALALLEAGEAVDLLVSDLSMPGLDGVALIREAQRRRPGLPAILLTGYAGDAAALALDGAVRGSFSLLRKPVSEAQLTDRVAALLGAPRSR
ncbi:response regulator [Roseomonas nepalensis]|uniref:histidine kinase n=1 Tax=Muricoccus nepalensis TaxID=1854500 RepID=A0A502FD16_9PROT|nr:ATP-binding protein [Roseomonas nepalensis]TPG47307.1 response regulator [Roseomonas nepalensis]